MAEKVPKRSRSGSWRRARNASSPASLSTRKLARALRGHGASRSAPVRLGVRVRGGNLLFLRGTRQGVSKTKGGANRTWPFGMAWYHVVARRDMNHISMNHRKWPHARGIRQEWRRGANDDGRGLCSWLRESRKTPSSDLQCSGTSETEGDGCDPNSREMTTPPPIPASRRGDIHVNPPDGSHSTRPRTSCR